MVSQILMLFFLLGLYRLMFVVLAASRSILSLLLVGEDEDVLFAMRGAARSSSDLEWASSDRDMSIDVVAFIVLGSVLLKICAGQFL